MRKRALVGMACLTLVAGIASAQQLAGPAGQPAVPLNPPAPPEATELLFQGDLTAELGIGCSNTPGTSGGPNDWALNVTASLTPPFGIVSMTYNIFTNISPNITAFSAVAWAGGGSPGAEIGRSAGAPFSQGNHTFNLSNPIVVNSAQFFPGFNQPQSNVGIRIGQDSSSGSTGNSFIRAAVCGASSFVLIDVFGLPGEWVYSTLIDDTIPVELMTFEVD